MNKTEQLEYARRTYSEFTERVKQLNQEREYWAKRIGTLQCPYEIGTVLRRLPGTRFAGKLFVVFDAIADDVENGTYTLYTHPVDELKDKVIRQPYPFTVYPERTSFEVAEGFSVEDDNLVRAVPKRVKPGFEPRKIGDKAEIVPKIIRKRVENGFDYGTDKRHVLLRKGNKDLIWTSGFGYFGGRGITAYSPATLAIYNWTPGKYRSATDLHEGGRLSKALLKRFDAKIREAFEIDFDFSEVFDHRGTVIAY